MKIKNIVYTELRKSLSYSEYLSQVYSNLVEFCCIDSDLLDKIKSLAPELDWRDYSDETATPGEHFPYEFEIPLSSVSAKVTESEFIELRDKFYQFCVDNGIITCSN